MAKRKNRVKSLAEELDIFDDMLDTLIELLEEKGILTHGELEKRLKKRLLESSKMKSYRDIEFKNRRR